MSAHAIGTSAGRFTGPDTWDAIVVGSGIGGLATAWLLGRKAAKRVLVLERHYTAGGFTHSFRRPGYEWDVGVHYVGRVGRADADMGLLFREIAGDSLHWASMGDVYDTIVLGDRRFDYVVGRDRWRERLIEYFPGERRAIDEYLAAVESAVRGLRLYFAEKAMPRPVAALTGTFMRSRFLRWARQTTRAVLESLTANQTLIAVLTGQWGDYGLPPAESSFGMHAIVTHHYFEGGFYPVGGARAIAAAIVPRIESLNGAVVVDAEVTRLLVERGRVVGVQLAGGREFKAPIVVSDAGLRRTLALLPGGVPGRSVLDRVTARVAPSAAHACLYVGLSRDDAELGLEKRNLWVYQDEAHEKALARFASDPDQPFPLAFVSFPSAKDPTFGSRYPGRATIEVVTLARYEWFERWAAEPWRRRGEPYAELKARLTERLLDVLYREVPSVRGHVEVAELSTPLSTRHFAGYDRGEIYGLAHTPTRFAERGLRPATPVTGLWLTGQDVATCGVGGALSSGYLTASAIVGRPVFPRG